MDRVLLPGRLAALIIEDDVKGTRRSRESTASTSALPRLIEMCPPERRIESRPESALSHTDSAYGQLVLTPDLKRVTPGQDVENMNGHALPSGADDPPLQSLAESISTTLAGRLFRPRPALARSGSMNSGVGVTVGVTVGVFKGDGGQSTPYGVGDSGRRRC